MKLSVKRKLGFIQVHGGRVLVASHDHQVATDTYDPGSDHVLGLARPLERWTTVSVGDLAIEIMASRPVDGVPRVLGYMYLSGRAINVIRYVCDHDRALVAGWLATGKGLRFNLDHDYSAVDPTQFIASMMELKYGGADLACAAGVVEDVSLLQPAMKVLAMAYSYADDSESARQPTTDVLVKLTVKGSKELGTVHFQPAKRNNQYACQPFAHDLLLSSTHLSPHEFLAGR